MSGKKQKYSKGSTLVMVMIVFVIMTILGMALGTMTISNYLLRSSQEKQKTALYIAESGLDETYARLMGAVQEGTKESDEVVKEIYSKFELKIEDANKSIENGQSQSSVESILKENIEYSKKYNFNDVASYDNDVKITIPIQFSDIDPEKSYIKRIVDKEGNVTGYELNNDILKSDFEKWFKSYYKEYMNMRVTKEYVSSKYYYDVAAELNETNKKADILNVKIDKFDDLKEEMSLALNLEYIYKEHPKNINTKLNIYIPKYGNVYSFNNLKLKDIPLLNKALITDSNLNIKPSTIEENNLEGDVYAYGIKVASNINDQEGLNKQNGIILQNNTNLRLSGGNFSTGGYLKLKSNVNLIGDGTGEIFANTMEIPYEDSNQKVNLNTGYNVNTLDDIELNGEDWEFVLGGNYFGFNDGSIKKINQDQELNDNRPDSSSGIVVNTEKPDSFKLQIDGNGKAKSYAPEGLNKAGSILSGVAYIRGDNDKFYQTGESVSIIGNYRIYSRTNGTDEYAYSNTEPFVEVDPLPPMFDRLKGTEDSNKLQKTKERAGYFNQLGANKENEVLMTIKNIDIKNVLYSLGVFVDSGNLYYFDKDDNRYKNGVKEKDLKSVDKATFEWFKNMVVSEYKYFINKMGASNYSLESGNSDLEKKDSIKSYLTDKDDISLTYDKIKDNNDYYDFNGGALIVVENGKVKAPSDVTEQLNIKENKIKSNGSIAVYVKEGETFKGRIVAAGAVALNLEKDALFEGEIFCDGDLKIEGTQPNQNSSARGVFYSKVYYSNPTTIGIGLKNVNLEGLAMSESNVTISGESTAKGVLVAKTTFRVEKGVKFDIQGSVVAVDDISLEGRSNTYKNSYYKNNKAGESYQTLAKYPLGMIFFKAQETSKSIDASGLEFQGTQTGKNRISNLVKIVFWREEK